MIVSLLPYALWIKAFHVISVISWMAGQFYLPRLFVYHCQAKVGSEESERFKVMERKLLRMIINPAMILAFIFGILLALMPGMINWNAKWWVVKLVAILLLTAYHGACVLWWKQFLNDQNRHSENYYRLMNEVPTVLMIVIVIMVVVQPF